MKKSNEKGKINMKKMIAFLLAAVFCLGLTQPAGVQMTQWAMTGATAAR